MDYSIASLSVIIAEIKSKVVNNTLVCYSFTDRFREKLFTIRNSDDYALEI